MTGKSILTAGALMLATLGIASAKSYDIVLTAPAMAGTNELKSGDYKVKIEGAQAVFTDAQNEKSFTVPVKVENTDKKFDNTQVNASKEGGTDVVKDIELGGSKTKLDFGM